MTEFPEFATYVGYPGQNARWTDNSLQAIERRKRELQHHLRTRQSLVDQVLAAVAPTAVASEVRCSASPPSEPRGTLTLKRYHNE